MKFSEASENIQKKIYMHPQTGGGALPLTCIHFHSPTQNFNHDHNYC